MSDGADRADGEGLGGAVAAAECGVWVRMLPDPESALAAPVNYAEVFEVVSHAPGEVSAAAGAVAAGESNGQVVGEALVVREHPEVPLTLPQRDEVVATLGYRRTGSWIEHRGGRAVATAARISAAD